MTNSKWRRLVAVVREVSHLWILYGRQMFRSLTELVSTAHVNPWQCPFKKLSQFMWLQRDSNLWPLRRRCNALTCNWATKWLSWEKVNLLGSCVPVKGLDEINVFIYYIKQQWNASWAFARKHDIFTSENKMLPSQVKRSMLLWSHNKSRRCSALGLQKYQSDGSCGTFSLVLIS